MHTLHGVFYLQNLYDNITGKRICKPLRRDRPSPRQQRRRVTASILAFHLLAWLAGWSFPDSCARAQIATHVVISEVYGGGGNAGAQYKHDFVELYNPLADAVVMTGWSIQYASSGGSFSAANRTVFSGTIPARSFFLIQLAQGSGGLIDLPAPDAVGTTALASTNGKVALVNDTLLITGPTDGHVVDFIGYGTATQFEGSGPVPPLGNTLSAERKALASSTDTTMAAGGGDEFSGNGFDTDNNAADFIRRSVQVPQNSLAPAETPPGADTTMSCTYSGRWNLVALPLKMHSTAVPDLFPGASSPAFAYSGGYGEEDSLENGTGYWMKFPAPMTFTWTGSGRTTDTVNLVPGWNLIGSLSVPVAVAGMVQNPPSIVLTPFYGYADGYSAADTLFPARGYWVKSSAAGSLIMWSGSAARNNNFIIR